MTGVDAARRGEPHDVEVLARLLGVLEGRHYLGVLEDAAVLDGAVDLDEVLIYDAAGADVQVAHLRVAHLSVGQTNILAASQQLGVGIVGVEIIELGRGGVVDHVGLVVLADAPAIQYH